MTDSDEIADDATEATLPVGTLLGKYQIARLLGAGGMGAVYEASHTEIGKRVAIKVLGPSIAAVPGARARFLREAQLTSKVRHPNIVDVTDMGNEGGQAFLVMEFLEGEDLSQRLTRGGRMSPVELVEIMLPVCSAVVAAHQAGITHRDLKPQNIFLAVGPHGLQAKVLDFGISKGTDKVGAGTLTGTGAMIGTPFYLAPEQIMDGKSAGPGSDQYALGVILYECLTGRRPFEADNLFVVFQAIVNGAPPPLRELRPDLSPQLAQVVERAFHVDPKQRYSSVRALGRALLPFASPRARLLWDEAFAGAEDPRLEAFASAPEGRGSLLGGGTTVPFGAPLRQTTPTMVEGGKEGGKEGGGSGRRGSSFALDARAPAGTETWDVVSARTGTGRVKKAVAIAVGLGAAALVAVWLSKTNAPPPEPAARPASVRSSSQTEPRAQPAIAKPPSPPPFKVSVAAEPDEAALELDGERVGTGHLERALASDHHRHILRVSADGFEPRTVEFTDSPPPERIVLPALAPPPPPPPPVTPPPVRRSGPRTARRPTPEPAVEPPPAPTHNLNPNGAPVID